MTCYVIKIKIQKLNFFVLEKKVTFVFIKFCYEIKDVDSKREGLEIISLHLKSCFMFPQILSILRKGVTRHIT